MIEVYTSHWRSPLLADVDATIIGISRGEPRWSLPYRYRRLRDLAPSDETWAHDDTDEFEKAYVRQLEQIGAGQILERIAAVAGGRPAVLLCWERPHEEFCHRWTLAAFLRGQTGLVVAELEHGM